MDVNFHADYPFDNGNAFKSKLTQTYLTKSLYQLILRFEKNAHEPILHYCLNLVKALQALKPKTVKFKILKEYDAQLTIVTISDNSKVNFALTKAFFLCPASPTMSNYRR